MGKRLSLVSSVLPRSSVSKDRVEDDEKFSHAGCEGNLDGLSGAAQMAIEGGNDGVPAAGDEGGHVERGSNAGPPAPGGAPTAPVVTISIEGRDADQGGDLLAPERAEFGQATVIERGRRRATGSRRGGSTTTRSDRTPPSGA